MPRHLMVRRFNDSAQGHHTLPDNVERVPLTQHDSNVIIDGSKTMKFGTSTNYQQNYSTENTIMETEMSWESLRLIRFDNDNDNNYDKGFNNTPETTGDKSLKHDGCRLMIKDSSLNSRAPQACPVRELDFGKDRKDHLVLPFQQSYLSSSSTFPDHRSIKIDNHSPGKRNNQNFSEYGVLGVKKNFLRRSESSSYLRLHVSPSKSCVKTPSPRSTPQSGLTLKSCKQNSNKYSPSKNVSFSKHVVISRLMRLSELGTPTRADISPVLDNCQLSLTTSETDTGNAKLTDKLGSSLATTCISNSNMRATNHELICSRNNSREMTHKTTQETECVTAPVLQPVSRLSKVLEERTSLGHFYDPSETVLDLSLPTKQTKDNVDENNKENSPPFSEVKKVQGSRCDNQERTDPKMRVPGTDVLSQIPKNNLLVQGDNLHIAQPDPHIAQPDLHIAQPDLHIAKPDLHIAQPDLHTPYHDLDIRNLDPSISKRKDTGSVQQGFADDDDAHDGGDSDNGNDDDDCSNNADTGISCTTGNNGELQLPQPAASSSTMSSLPSSAVCDFLQPASMCDQDIDPYIDVVGDLPSTDAADTPEKIRVYADSSSHLDSGVNGDMSSNVDSGINVEMSSHVDSGVNVDTSSHVDSGVNVDTSSHVDSGVNVDRSSQVGSGVKVDRSSSSHVDSGYNGDISTHVDSGVNVDRYSLPGSSIVRDDLYAPAATTQYYSHHTATLLRLPSSADDRTPSNLFIPPTIHHPKPMHSSTPLRPDVRSWFPSQLPFHFMPMLQQGAFAFLPGASTQSHYPVQPATSVFSQYANGAVPSSLTHPAFNLLGFPSQPVPSNSRPLTSDQFASQYFNPSLFMDQPLNLTNRRPFQASTSDRNTPQHSMYSPLSSPAIVPMVSPSPNLYHLTSTPTGLYPMARSSGSHFPGDSRSSQSVPIFSSTPNVTGPSYVFPALRVTQESPLNMSSEAGRLKHKSSDRENTEGESENKRSRVTKRSKKVNKRLDLTNVDANIKTEVNAESTQNSQSATKFGSEQLIRGVVLSMPPSHWRPISHLMKAKEKFGENDRKTSRALKSKENVGDGDLDAAKQRNKPELFGEKDISEIAIVFHECPERARFCDGNFKFQAPKIPDSSEGQTELREALMRLFANSSLPPVPSALKHSVHALSQYPFMQHIFNLHIQGVDLDSLKFGAYGLAFENIRLVELGEQTFNDILDRMSYLGDDDLLHCLVKSEKTGAVCGHVAREIGKIRRHSKNHYPDKKWVCAFCRVQMCDMTDLERHTATHTELKPFECQHCSKKFCQKVTLTQHMHKTHGQQLAKWDAKSSYICRQDGCSYSQGDEEACVRHLKQHHGSTDYIKRKNQNKWPFNILSADAIKILDEES